MSWIDILRLALAVAGKIAERVDSKKGFAGYVVAPSAEEQERADKVAIATDLRLLAAQVEDIR